MVKQTINVGTIPNDSTGDTLRVAFTKTNANFTELYTINNTLSNVAFTSSYTDLLNIPAVVDASRRLINGSQELLLGANGTLNISTPSSDEFMLTLSPANYVPTLSKPTLTLTSIPWELNGQYEYGPDGTTQLFKSIIFPKTTNPGYTSGDEFQFDSTVHGIDGFILTITLNNVVQAGPAGWTANIVESAPPVYPTTIKSMGAVKVTANDSSWIFGTDGVLHYPDGSFSNTAFVGQATSAETLVNQNNATVTTGPVLGTQRVWTFDTDGNLTLPAGGDIVDSVGTSVLGVGASTDVYKFQFGTIGTKDNPDTGGWGGYNITIDPGGESNAGLFIPSVAAQDGNASLNIYNNKAVGNSIALTLASGNFIFEGTGTLELPHPPNVSFNDPSIKFADSTSVSTNNFGFSVPGPVAGVVYNATTLNLASMKLLITIEGLEDGGDGLNHTQVCEMLVVRRVGATSSTVDSVVYGVIHTSLGPLATLTTQQSVDGRVQILAQPINTTPIYVKVHATEVRRGD